MSYNQSTYDDLLRAREKLNGEIEAIHKKLETVDQTIELMFPERRQASPQPNLSGSKGHLSIVDQVRQAMQERFETGGTINEVVRHLVFQGAFITGEHKKNYRRVLKVLSTKKDVYERIGEGRYRLRSS